MVLNLYLKFKKKRMIGGQSFKFKPPQFVNINTINLICWEVGFKDEENISLCESDVFF